MDCGENKDTNNDVLVIDNESLLVEHKNLDSENFSEVIKLFKLLEKWNWEKNKEVNGSSLE